VTAPNRTEPSRTRTVPDMFLVRTFKMAPMLCGCRPVREVVDRAGQLLDDECPPSREPTQAEPLGEPAR